MSSPMFDGQYRSKPLISLRGASRQVERGGLLEKAQKEREFREGLRRQKLAALTLQATYRGHRVRRVVYAQFRARFDELCSTCSSADDVLLLSRLSLLFYHRNTDKERLVKLCQKWLQFRSNLSSLAISSSSCLVHLSRLLSWSCDMVSSPLINPTLLLRTIEVFLEPANHAHSDHTHSDHAHSVTSILSKHVITNHFFRSLIDLLKLRVPPPEDLDATPTPLAASLLGYLTRPLIGGGGSGFVYKFLANEVLSSSRSPHVTYYVLPHLRRCPDVDLSALVGAIHAGVTNGGVVPSLELLYAVIQLVHFRLPSVETEGGFVETYLHLVSMLLSKLPSGHGAEGSMGEEEEEEEEGEGRMEEEGEEDPLSSHDAMLRHCLATLGGEQLPTCLQLRRHPTLPVLNQLCSLCYQLIRHAHIIPYNRTRLFQSLALNSDLLKHLWSSLSQLEVKRTFGDPVLCLQQLARGLTLPPPHAVTMVSMLSTYCVLFNLYLNTLHDAEFYREREVPVSSQMPFSLRELAAMGTVCRDVFINVHMERHLPPSYTMSRMATSLSNTPHPQEWVKLKHLLLELIHALYQRDCRRPFCPEGHWVAPGLIMAIPPELFIQNEGEEEEQEVVNAPPHIAKHAELLRLAPFVFPFVERVQFFRTLITHDRANVQGRHQDFLMGPRISLTIRRDHVYEDAFSELARDADLRKKLRVMFVNAQGLNEPGIDGGGVFREFLSEVLKTGFDPNRGYFSTTPDGQLYPSFQSHLINEDSDLHYRFLGSMLGKALYESQLVELPFAGFFLCKLAAPGHGFVGTHHLASFDPDLYRNLLSLKYYDGDVEDLSLNFTMTTMELGQSKVYELKRGGSEVAVTKGNCVEYIHLMAHYRLNVQLHRQFQAFRSGLLSVIPAHWFSLFNQNELQVLISGAQVPIDVEDLKKNTNYGGEYKEDHPSISMFWGVVNSFSDQQKCQLLKFVTACSRPPLLGFKELHPPFMISPGVGDSHLPSASTCMNFLKLPKFQDKEKMREKLLYAIESGAGFELS